MLKILRFSDKRCFWCNSQKDCVDVEFDDKTFSGTLCRGDMWRLLRARSNGRTKDDGSKRIDKT